MGSNEAPELEKIPFIDFSKPSSSAADDELKPGTAYWDSVRTQVRKALEEYGCFEASFDRVPSDLRSDTFDLLEELFDLPLSTKQRSVAETAHLGYLGQQLESPLYESIGIHDPNSLDKVEICTNALWPQGNPSFSESMHSLSKKVTELDQIVRRMIIEGFRVEKYMDEHMRSTKYNLRVMKYESPKTLDPKLGLKAHTDKNMISILWQNQVEGLEVGTKKGHWLRFQPSPTSFLVMIGDSFYAWLNGRVHCPHHRVMMCGNEPRYSFGLFSTVKPGYTIRAPEELIDEQHPRLFKPIDYKQFLAFAFSEAGRKEANPLRACFGL